MKKYSQWYQGTLPRGSRNRNQLQNSKYKDKIEKEICVRKRSKTFQLCLRDQSRFP